MDNERNSSSGHSHEREMDDILNMNQLVNGVVDMNVMLQLQQQIHLRNQGSAMTILCVVAYFLNMLSVGHGTRSITIMDIPQKESRGQELMSYLVHTEQCRDIIRRGPKAFIPLCQQLRETDFVHDGLQLTVEEQAAKFLYIIGHNVKNKSVSFFFHRSGETVSRHFHNVTRQ